MTAFSSQNPAYPATPKYPNQFRAQGKAPSGYNLNILQKLNPQQQQIFSSLYGGSQPGMEAGLDYLSGLAMGNDESFAQTEAPAMRQFQGLAGQISSRFSGMGMGGRRSSGFQNMMGQQTSDFAQDLMAKRMAIRDNAIKSLTGIGQQLLGTETQIPTLTQKQQKPTSSWASIGLPLAGAAVGALAGNPFMADAASKGFTGAGGFGALFSGMNPGDIFSGMNAGSQMASAF